MPARPQRRARMNTPFKPTKAELEAAREVVIPDLIKPELRVLFCGINPGLYSGATGHHFARPGNRFWPALHIGGFTPRVLSAFEEEELLDHGCGITNVVARTTAAASELDDEEFATGGKRLRRKIARYQPKLLAVLGIGAYRLAFDRPEATLGMQPDRIGETRVWVLPNPSGLNAHYTAAKLGALFAEMREAI